LLADALHKDTFFDGADSYFEYEHENPPWEEASTKCERVYALLSMAVLCREQDELAKSRSNLQQALREFLEFSHSEDQADADVQSLMGQIFLEMANQFLESDDLLSAYRFACHTVKLAYEIKEDSLYANAIATLGVIVGLDGQLDISFQLLSEAAHRHREMEDHEGYIIDLMNLGELVSRDGMWETSATLLDQAIELSRQHECINLFLKASEIRNEVESIMRVKQTDPQRN
jgi:tetratricopeptide (TPR) repeat protein